MGLIPESPDKRPARPYLRGLLVLVVVLLAFLLLDLISHRPGSSGFFLLGLMVVALAGSLWWSYLESIRVLRRRTRIAIAAVLSDGQGRDSEVIVLEVRCRIHASRHPAFRWLRLEGHILEEMTRQRLLDFRDGKYSESR